MKSLQVKPLPWVNSVFILSECIPQMNIKQKLNMTNIDKEKVDRYYYQMIDEEGMSCIGEDDLEIGRVYFQKGISIALENIVRFMAPHISTGISEMNENG